MSILFVTSDFGSDIYNGFMPLVATALADRGHDVVGLQYEEDIGIDTIPVKQRDVDSISTPWWVGKRVLYRQWRPVIREFLEEHDFSLVVTDKSLATPTTFVAEEIGIPTVFVVPGLGFTRFAPRDLGYDKRPSFRALPNSAKLQYPFIKSLFKLHKSRTQSASEVVVLSRYLRNSMYNTFDCQSRVLRTPVLSERVRADEYEREYVTLVNPRHPLKGSDIFFKIAKKNPEENFLVAGEFPCEKKAKIAAKLDNVRHRGWVDDMREVYQQTKLLLVPSLYEEGGPRVIVEGFANGIPAVGTDRGGIPEFIGEAGLTVTDPYDITEWEYSIDAVLSEYEFYSKRASDRMVVFELESQIDQFEYMIKEYV